MSTNLDKSTWKRIALGDVAEASKEKVNPTDGIVARYVAGEHMDTDDLKIHRWGEVGDGYLGPAFHRRFRAGQVLYGSRRTYLRKVAVADFEGVCANTTFVVQTKDAQRLLSEFLPWVMTSESFHAFAIAESKGSVNPYVNWSDIARYQFNLPPVEEQERISNLMWSVQRDVEARKRALDAAVDLRGAHVRQRLAEIAGREGSAVTLDSLIAEGRPICYGILMPGSGVDDGVPVVKVKDFPDGSIHEDRLLRTTPEIARQYQRSTLRDGDLLISIRGTVGRLAKVPPSLDGANITQDTARLSIDESHNADYVRLALESEYVQLQIRRQITGLAVKGLNIGALREILIPIPRDPVDEVRLLEEAERLAGLVDASRRAIRQANLVKRALLSNLDAGVA